MVYLLLPRLPRQQLYSLVGNLGVKVAISIQFIILVIMESSDSGELMAQVQTAFNINIPPEVSEKLLTVGHLHREVWAQMGDRGNRQCLTQRVFYQLRNALAESPAPGYVLTPSTILAPLIPAETRKTLWVNIEQSTGLKLPRFVFSLQQKIRFAMCNIILLFITVYCAYFLNTRYQLGYWTLIPLGIGLINLIMLIERVCYPLKKTLPVGTLGELTNETVTINAAMLTRNGASKTDVEKIINYIIRDTIGVGMEEILPEKRFVQDLGVD